MSFFIAVDGDRDSPLWIKNFGCERSPRKARWGPTTRSCHILHYVLKGSGYFNGHRVETNQGFYIAPDTLQEYHASADNPWQYFWIMFSGSEAQRYANTVICPDSRGIFACPFADHLENLAGRMKLEPPEFSHFTALSWFYQVLALHEKPQNRGNATVRRAKSYISANYHRDITVQSTADALHVDDRYLYNLFVKHENTTPKKYIDTCRIRAACELLSRTEASITEIAVAVGFEGVSRFSRFFALHMGLSPTEYRKRHAPAPFLP